MHQLLLVLLGLLTCICTRHAVAAEVTAVVRAARILDVEKGAILTGHEVRVAGERIVAVAPATSGSPRRGVTILDLGDATLLPGLIDVHTHLIDDAMEYSPAAPLTRSGAQMAYRAIPNALATLRAGFTTVRDLGTYRALVDVALRDAIDRGWVAGPRMQPAGAYVTMTGGAGALTGLAPDVTLPLELRFGVADGPDQVRQRVRALARGGVGVIKVLSSGAILTPGSVPGAREFTDEELGAAVDEAARAGLKVACHAHGAEGAKAAIRAGVASIEHGSLLDDEGLRMMKAKGIFLAPNVPEGEADAAASPGHTPEMLASGEGLGGALREVTRKAHRLGVPLAFGTDAAVIPHGTNAKQFAEYVACGLTPLEAIRTATTNAARLLGWEDRVGRLTPGAFADMIAVGGNPLEDVKRLEKPLFVMKGGGVIVGPSGVAR
ncbi:MAG: amidohydrolase family protein [Candidatus Wallbacteria bacterium]|nr:amidohydrolase family protein [Candidatus Wallbacteria bacterium]